MKLDSQEQAERLDGGAGRPAIGEGSAAVPPAPSLGPEPRWRSALLLAASILLLIAAWQAASSIVGGSVLPGPWPSISAIRYSYQDGYLWSDIAITSLRILSAFALALGLSVIGGVLLGSFRIVQRVFGPWVTIAASIPALVYVVVAYLAGGLTDVSATVATALVVGPTMTFNIWDGMRAINPEFAEMARAFRVPRWTIVQRVLVPQTFPFLFTAARAGLSLTWRIMIFVELVGRQSGVGYRIQYWYNLFNMQRVLASAIPFLVLMLLLELGVLRPAERFVFRWRREELQ